MFSPDDKTLMADLYAALSDIQQHGGRWGTASYIAEKLIIELWRDVEKVKSCRTCAYFCDCDPDAEYGTQEQKIWAECRGSLKLNWKWRGAE